MIKINFSNAEELIFWNQEVQKLLPAHLFSIFEQWRMAKRIPFLKEMGKQAVLDLLNNITEEDVDLLEQHFQEKIIIEKLNYHITREFKVPLNDPNLCNQLCEITGFNYFSTWRDHEFLYISFWR